jgi:hypothetical protein
MQNGLYGLRYREDTALRYLPFCNKKRPFKKENEHYKLVKDINLDHPVLLKARVVYAKSGNPDYNHQSFSFIEDILILKQKTRNIFLLSKSRTEAYQKRDELTRENWQIKNQHFANIIKFLNTPYFEYMTTFLDHPETPKNGNSENIIRTWRQMEKARYGFKSAKGRIAHLTQVLQ